MFIHSPPPPPFKGGKVNFDYLPQKGGEGGGESEKLKKGVEVCCTGRSS